MDDDKWHDINAALKRYADVEANWPTRVGDELTKITRAAETVTKQLEGHQCELVVCWADEAEKIWDTIEISLVREADEYCFPVTLTVKLNSEREMRWRRSGPNDKVVKAFVGRNSEGEWAWVIAQMVAANAKAIGA